MWVIESFTGRVRQICEPEKSSHARSGSWTAVAACRQTTNALLFLYSSDAHRGVKILAGLCLADLSEPSDLSAAIGRIIMPTFSPELIQTMRAALEEAMTKVPLEQVTPGIKAHLAECILKAAAEGQTSYEGLIAAGDEITSPARLARGQH